MKGRLSQTEKYIIQGMKHEGKTVEEIATEIDRGVDCVSKYINVELDKLHNTITKVTIDSAEKPVVKLVNPPPKGQAMRTMILKTGMDKKGVAIMTSASAQVGDDFLKAIPKNVSRTARGNLYDIDGKKR
jgi:hypothetical protein